MSAGESQHLLSRVGSQTRAGSGGGRFVAGGEAEDLIERLPPLPAASGELWQERLCGAVVVVSVVYAFNAFAGSFSGDALPVVTWATRVYSATALLCWLHVVFGDPGVVHRCKETCLPLPEEVADCLQRGVQNIPFGNVSHDGASYCVRCFVWRRGSDAHHCRTCNKCVLGFDHHCSVLGHCIAGRNLASFSVLLLMVAAGIVTFAVAGVFSTVSGSSP
eukprot:TRINITY_DN12180_c0_g1_i1.p1 TRINITY_DN12180_c0_g1~~TRINITY_DN12180_c0_g1_i1.p1  ORF type:complete len:228 (+),score=59.66 TRINITY_DN12180_c0_g1_i1:28-684(+)